MKLIQFLEESSKVLLMEKFRHKIEKAILRLAIASFLVHLLIIVLLEFKVIDFAHESELLNNPIAAIYTPFSFILLYEVYLLIYYLPKSFTTYIGKQYEIITLIIIRRLFKDLSNLDLKGDWFKAKYNLQFTYDLLSSLIIFILIYLFYKQSHTESAIGKEQEIESIPLVKFIKIKKAIALLLLPVFFLLSIYSFATWAHSVLNHDGSAFYSFNNINNIFFEQFFNMLIFADVLILLVSFFMTDEFHKVIRNSGFIISTILIRISFSASGLENNILIIAAIVFGLLMLMIHNQFEKGRPQV